MNDSTSDTFDLDRFVAAQKDTYQHALSEVAAGRKRSHWMWFIFPQMRGLGLSPTAQRYGITGEEEARAYLAHDVLGERLIAICEAALAVQGRSARDIFGIPDNMKLRSCATLFASVSEAGSVFHQLLDKYFDGQADEQTMQMLQS